jgi:hypothetical protein
MLVYRSSVAVAMIIGALLVGCTAPDQPTDLRTDGPPNVTTVTVMSDLSGQRLLETATYCRLGDEKRPSLVGLPTFTVTQVCPDDLGKGADKADVAEGAPPVWFVRVVFDKLLDPTIEDIVPVNPANPDGPKVGTLVNTQPVTLTCINALGASVAVPYGGYYAPNGNRISYPLGPDLFIQPTTATSVPTGTSCQIVLKDNIVNKKGDKVPDDQRTYKFKIGPMALRFTVPDSDPEVDEGIDTGDFEQDFDAKVQLFWTAPVKTPVDTTDYLIFEAPNTVAGDPDPTVCDGGGTAVPSAQIIAAPEGPVAGTTALQLNLSVMTAGHAWKPSTTYRIEFGPAAKALASQGSIPGTPDGAIPEGLKLCFHTPAAM